MGGCVRVQWMSNDSVRAGWEADGRDRRCEVAGGVVTGLDCTTERLQRNLEENLVPLKSCVAGLRPSSCIQT